MPQIIGFIGLGIMGRPMAKNLLKAGYPLVVHSRSQGPVEELVKAGAKRASSAREVAGQVDVLITMLPNSPEVELVALGADGIARLRFVDRDQSRPPPELVEMLVRESAPEVQHVAIEGVAPPGLLQIDLLRSRGTR